MIKKQTDYIIKDGKVVYLPKAEWKRLNENDKTKDELIHLRRKNR